MSKHIIVNIAVITVFILSSLALIVGLIVVPGQELQAPVLLFPYMLGISALLLIMFGKLRLLDLLNTKEVVKIWQIVSFANILIFGTTYTNMTDNRCVINNNLELLSCEDINLSQVSDQNILNFCTNNKQNYLEFFCIFYEILFIIYVYSIPTNTNNDKHDFIFGLIGVILSFVYIFALCSLLVVMYTQENDSCWYTNGNYIIGFLCLLNATVTAMACIQAFQNYYLLNIKINNKDNRVIDILFGVHNIKVLPRQSVENIEHVTPKY